MARLISFPSVTAIFLLGYIPNKPTNRTQQPYKNKNTKNTQAHHFPLLLSSFQSCFVVKQSTFVKSVHIVRAVNNLRQALPFKPIKNDFTDFVSAIAEYFIVKS